MFVTEKNAINAFAFKTDVPKTCKYCKIVVSLTPVYPISPLLDLMSNMYQNTFVEKKFLGLRLWSHA